METKEAREAHELINHVFWRLLPARGMAERPEQIRLSHRMLDAMLRGEIALCDAGTGIGKTYAYLVAGIAFFRYRLQGGLAFQPLMISTSSIALQHAIKHEYLPLLSAALLEDGIIQAPLLAVIRKGKSHYVCDARLTKRLRRVGLKNNKSKKALESLKRTFDLDSVKHLSDYDKNQVCVPKYCDCQEETCRYRRFLETCESGYYIFQICNHNLLLADAMHRRSGRRPIFPDYCALVVDESHKLPEAARQMFGVSLSGEDIQSLLHGLRKEYYILAAEYLSDAAEPLLQKLAQLPEGPRSFSNYERLLAVPYQVLGTIQRQLCRLASPALRRAIGNLVAAMTALMEPDAGFIRYAEVSDSGGTVLRATVSNLAPQLKSILWSQLQGMVLTSGTLAVGEDFGRFRLEAGIPQSGRVTESVTPSPFDYQSHCLLYLPQFPPERSKGAANYYDALTGEIARLVEAASGHCLVLFTSYAAMSAVQKRLTEMQLWYPIHAMGRNMGSAAEEFKKDPGGVLLATGPAWEGMDFPGDCVSLLVIPRLPFAYPDALRETQRQEYDNLQAFIRAVMVPEMQIKLRQGFGRAIRTDTDTCVIAILDDRAKQGRKYYTAMLEALPDIPMTSSLEDVERFIWKWKPDRYFKEPL